MNKHTLKTWKKPFSDILTGIKTFEIRKDDRDYNVGDILILDEFDNKSSQYTGNTIKCIVTYLIKSKDVHDEYGFKIVNVCIMSIKPLEIVI